MDFLIQNSCDRTAELDMNYCYEKHYSWTSNRLRLELYDKRTETHLYCTFNILRKFATVLTGPSEATVLSSINWIKALQSSRRSMTRNQRSGLSFAVR